ncbi:hypothetical protein F2P79_007042 [Pimephales promelas]|nr:hypothetical protein F2P79_007042 [Pimephales promelas]
MDISVIENNDNKNCVYWRSITNKLHQLYRLLLTAWLKFTFGLKWLRHRKTFSLIFAVPDLQMEIEALHCFVFVSVSVSCPSPSEEDPKDGDSQQHM